MQQLPNGTTYECRPLGQTVCHIIRDKDVCRIFTNILDLGKYLHLDIHDVEPNHIVMNHNDLPMLFDHNYITLDDAWEMSYAGYNRFQLLDTDNFLDYIHKLKDIFYNEPGLPKEAMYGLSLTQLRLAVVTFVGDFDDFDAHDVGCANYGFAMHLKACYKAKQILADISLSGHELDAVIYGIKVMQERVSIEVDDSDVSLAHGEYIEAIIDFLNNIG